MLNKAQAEKLFAENAVLFVSGDYVPRSVMEKIFGKEISDHIFTKGEAGCDFNAIGSNELLPNMIEFATKCGFFMAVSYQNALECAERSTS